MEPVERPVPNWTNWQTKQALSEIQGGEARTQKPVHDLDKKLIQFPCLRTSHPTRLFALHLLTISGHAAKRQQAWQKDRYLKRGFLNGGTAWAQCSGTGGGRGQDLQSCFCPVYQTQICPAIRHTAQSPRALPSPGKVLRWCCNRGVEHKDTGELWIYCSAAQSRITKTCFANSTDHTTTDFPPSSSLPFECFSSWLNTNTLPWRHGDSSKLSLIYLDTLNCKHWWFLL